MLMKEMLPALGLTEGHEETMDELLPGWREMEPVEFADKMRDVGGKLAQEMVTISQALKAVKKEEDE